MMVATDVSGGDVAAYPVFMPSGMGGALRRKPRSEART